MAQDAQSDYYETLVRKLREYPEALVGETIHACARDLITDWPEADWCHSPESHPCDVVDVDDETGNYVVKSDIEVGVVHNYNAIKDYYKVHYEDPCGERHRWQQIPGPVMRNKLRDGFTSWDTNGVPIGTGDHWYIG